MKFTEGIARGCFYWLRRNIRALSIFLASIFCVVAAWNFSLWQFFQFQRQSLDAPSCGDVLILTASHPQVSFPSLVIVPISCIGMMAFSRTDDLANRIVRQKSFRIVWLKRVLKSFWLSLAITVILTLSSLAASAFWAKGDMTFESSRSLFAYYTNGQTMPTPSFAAVLGLFFVYCLLIFFLMNTLWSLLDILFTQKWIPFLLVLIHSCLENFPGGVKLLYRWTGLLYHTWLPRGQHNLWIAAVLAAIIVVLGFLQSSRREIFHA